MRSTSWKPDRPYNTLPALPPKVEIETRAVLKQCITARAALWQEGEDIAIYV